MQSGCKYAAEREYYCLMNKIKDWLRGQKRGPGSPGDGGSLWNSVRLLKPLAYPRLSLDGGFASPMGFKYIHRTDIAHLIYICMHHDCIVNAS